MTRNGLTFPVPPCLHHRRPAHFIGMGRVIFIGTTTVVMFVMLACSSSNGTGSGTSATGGSSGIGGSVASGGTANAGGAVGTGASSGTGGFSGSGGDGGVNTGGTGGGVSPGKASIEFTAVGPDSYCMTSQCNAGASIGLKDSSGKALTLTTNCSDVSCKTCTSSACPGYFCQPNGIAITGAGLDWDGRNYVTSTCGAGTSCVEPAYAKPGKYTATMCATPGKLTGPDAGPRQCITSGPVKCGSVEFDFPSSTLVKGTVGP